MYDIDLYSNTYTETELIKSLSNLSFRRILKTQPNLSIEFICNYILNPELQVGDCDESLDVDYVICFHPHLKESRDKIIKILEDKYE